MFWGEQAGALIQSGGAPALFRRRLSRCGKIEESRANPATIGHHCIMQIHLSPRHIRLSAAIHAHVASVIGQVEDLAEIFAAHVVLEHDDAAKPADRNSAKIHLALQGRDAFATATAETIHAALDLVGAKLARQLRKKKTAAIDKPRRKAQRAGKSA